MTTFNWGQHSEGIDWKAIKALHGGSLLLTRDQPTEGLAAVCRLSAALQQADRAGSDLALFANELAYALFFDNSTRTKSSWAGASSRLGMRPVVVDGTSTQVAHGETARETGTMLGMNSHALGVRHDLILGAGNKFMRDMVVGLDSYQSQIGDARAVPLVNLQCDIDHPTQTLADLAWLNERFPDGLQGRKVAVSWAYSPSYAKPLSVPQGLISLLPRFGADVVLAHPPGYSLMPTVLNDAERFAGEGGGSFSVVENMSKAFVDADVVYPKSWGPYSLMMERVQANNEGGDSGAAKMAEIEARALQQNAEHRDWICDERRMALTQGSEALYMHCLPADIDAEVSPGVMAKAELDLAQQANKKVYVIMALLMAFKSADLRAGLDELLG